MSLIIAMPVIFSVEPKASSKSCKASASDRAVMPTEVALDAGAATVDPAGAQGFRQGLERFVVPVQACVAELELRLADVVVHVEHAVWRERTLDRIEHMLELQHVVQDGLADDEVEVFVPQVQRIEVPADVAQRQAFAIGVRLRFGDGFGCHVDAHEALAHMSFQEEPLGAPGTAPQ